MARTWLSVTVELLGGRGEELWPWPGRFFAVGPSHTFMDLADAINDAFARWDRSHLSVFTLADGRVITDEETGAEMAGPIRGPIIAPIDIAAATKDAARFLAAVTGHDMDDALQQVGAGIPMAVEQRRRDTEPVALSVINRLTWRGGPGDRLLAEDLLAGLRREPLTGRVVPVDLDMLSTVLEGDPELSTDGYLDLRTGQVYDDSAFVRFRDVLDGENLSEQWYAFSADRQIGRAREYLADHGIRVG